MNQRKSKELRRYVRMKNLNGQSFKTVYKRAKKFLKEMKGKEI